MSKGENVTPEFLAMNPFHTLPTLKDSDGTAVFESNAIVWYLREKYGDSQHLLPQGQHEQLATAARVQAFLSWYPVGTRVLSVG
jgi:glutathione S-transferase